MRHVVFVNGLARSGKDTVADMLIQAFEAAGHPAAAFSSIDPVRNMLISAGFDLSAKTDADRILLSKIGDAAEEHSGFRTEACFDAARRIFTGRQDSALILHTREPEMIRKIGARICDNFGNTGMTTIVVRGRGVQVPGSRADNIVGQMDYDIALDNSGSVIQLAGRVSQIVNTLTSF